MSVVVILTVVLTVTLSIMLILRSRIFNCYKHCVAYGRTNSSPTNVMGTCTCTITTTETDHFCIRNDQTDKCMTHTQTDQYVIQPTCESPSVHANRCATVSDPPQKKETNYEVSDTDHQDMEKSDTSTHIPCGHLNSDVSSSSMEYGTSLSHTCTFTCSTSGRTVSFYDKTRNSHTENI